MVPVLGKPLLEYQIEWLRNNGISNIVLATHHLHNVIEDHFKDGKQFAVSIKYIVEQTPLGTAGCVKAAEHLLDDQFLVLYGDTFTTTSLSDMISKARLFLLIHQMPEKSCQWKIAKII